MVSIPTLKQANFGRVYAAYGGIFIVLAILWGWGVDQSAPDRYDLNWRVDCPHWRIRDHVLAKRLKKVDDLRLM